MDILIENIVSTTIKIALWVAVVILVVAGVGVEDSTTTMLYNLSAGVCAIIYYQFIIFDRLDEIEGKM